MTETAPYGAAVRFARSTAARVAERTAARLDMRGPLGRELSEGTRGDLLELAGDLERIAADLRRMARPRAARDRHITKVTSGPPWTA